MLIKLTTQLQNTVEALITLMEAGESFLSLTQADDCKIVLFIWNDLTP